MTPIIYINPIPEMCGKCPCLFVRDYREYCGAIEDEDDKFAWKRIETINARSSFCPLKPLVLCGKCKLWENAFCNFHEMGMRAEDFCSYGVKA